MGGLNDNFALQVEGGGGVVEAYFRFFFVNLISLNLGICDDLIKTPFEWLSKFYTFQRNILILQMYKPTQDDQICLTDIFLEVITINMSVFSGLSPDNFSTLIYSACILKSN